MMHYLNKKKKKQSFPFKKHVLKKCIFFIFYLGRVQKLCVFNRSQLSIALNLHQMKKKKTFRTKTEDILWNNKWDLISNTKGFYKKIKDIILFWVAYLVAMDGGKMKRPVSVRGPYLCHKLFLWNYHICPHVIWPV